MEPIHTDRFAPGTGAYDYPAFFGALRRIGYTGRIAAENTWRDFPAEGGPSVAFLKRQWAAATGELGRKVTGSQVGG